MTQPPTDELRLVPCPFCGGDVINTRSQEMTNGPAYYWHKCETCGAESEGDYGEDVAVAAWNRRAAPASPLPGGGWRTDFENAPKDGSVFMVSYDDEAARKGRLCTNSERVYEACWNEVQETWSARNGFILHSDATHWMPLPAAPTGEPK